MPQFHGVPISIKDLNDTAGIRTTHGTAAWSDRIPDRDDEVVAKIRRAGFVILGKTVAPEFGPLNVSEPPAYPPGSQPLGPRAIVWRVVGWRRVGARRGPVPDLAGLGRRRIDQQPVVMVRVVRHQAVTQPRLSRTGSQTRSSRSTGRWAEPSPTPRRSST